MNPTQSMKSYINYMSNIIPTLSVIMPFRNAEKFLIQAVESVLNQSYKDFELILIDDASTDQSGNIINHLKKKDSRIIVITNLTTQGITKNLNKGILLSKGKYIARMDGDDICHLDRFEKQIRFLDERKTIDLIGSFVEEINEQDIAVGTILKETKPDLIARDIFLRGPCVHPSIMFRRKLIEKIGYYNEKYPYCQDTDLYYRTIFNGYKISNIPQILLKYRRHSFSSDKNRKLKGEISLQIKKEAIKSFKLKISITQYAYIYMYYIVETYFHPSLKVGLERIARLILKNVFK